MNLDELAQGDRVVVKPGEKIPADAEIILVHSSPLDTVEILDLSRAIYCKMIQNLAWVTDYNVVAVNARFLEV